MTIHLTPESAEYLAQVIELGNSALGDSSLFDLMEQIKDALRESNGASITVESAK